MTCVIGLKTQNDVYLAADSVCTDTQTLHLHTRNERKIFTNGNAIFGYSGLCRLPQVVEYNFKMPKQTQKDDMEFLCSTFVDALRKCFKKASFTELQSGREFFAGQLLLGYKNNIYEIEGDFTIMNEINAMAGHNFTAIGCGRDLALGSLYSSSTVKDHKVRLREALEVAEKYSSGVAKPFWGISLKTKKYFKL